jgi:hypothetical protein
MTELNSLVGTPSLTYVLADLPESLDVFFDQFDTRDYFFDLCPRLEEDLGTFWARKRELAAGRPVPTFVSVYDKETRELVSVLDPQACDNIFQLSYKDNAVTLTILKSRQGDVRSLTFPV